MRLIALVFMIADVLSIVRLPLSATPYKLSLKSYGAECVEPVPNVPKPDQIRTYFASKNRRHWISSRLYGGCVNQAPQEPERGNADDAEQLAAAAEKTISDLDRKIATRPSSSLGKASWAIYDCLGTLISVLWGSGGISGERLARDTKLETAADQFVRAATAFKLERKWRRAGETLSRAGDCYAMHSELGFEAVRYLRASGGDSHRCCLPLSVTSCPFTLLLSLPPSLPPSFPPSLPPLSSSLSSPFPLPRAYARARTHTRSRTQARTGTRAGARREGARPHRDPSPPVRVGAAAPLSAPRPVRRAAAPPVGPGPARVEGGPAGHAGAECGVRPVRRGAGRSGCTAAGAGPGALIEGARGPAQRYAASHAVEGFARVRDRQTLRQTDRGEERERERE